MTAASCRDVLSNLRFLSFFVWESHYAYKCLWDPSLKESQWPVASDLCDRTHEYFSDRAWVLDQGLLGGSWGIFKAELKVFMLSNFSSGVLCISFFFYK